VCDRGGAKPEGSEGCEDSGTKPEALDRGTKPDEELGMLYRGPRVGDG